MTRKRFDKMLKCIFVFSSGESVMFSTKKKDLNKRKQGNGYNASYDSYLFLLIFASVQEFVIAAGRVQQSDQI